MGIEIAGVALGTILSGAAAAATLYTTLSQSGKKGDAPMVQGNTPPPAGAKTPDAQVFRRRNATASGAGAGSTLLTGAGGVDPAASTLGKNTLLGM